MSFSFLNSIYAKSLAALYRLNVGKDDRSRLAVVDAIFEGLVIGKEGLDESKLEMALDTATGDWLDYWGRFYGVPRVFDEQDDPYRIRIIEEIIAPKSTVDALKDATARHICLYHKVCISGGAIQAFEPWTRLLKLDQRGTLDGSGRLISYEYWNYGVVDISIPDSTYITPELIRYLQRVKAGGVRLVFSIIPDWDIVKDALWEENRYNVWLKDYRRTEMLARRHTNAFQLLLDGKYIQPNVVVLGGRLDQFQILEGNRLVYWEGVALERTFSATGVIRNPFGSAVLSLEDYVRITGKANMTIQDGYNLDQQTIDGTRTNEGPLTITQGWLEITHEPV